MNTDISSAIFLLIVIIALVSGFIYLCWAVNNTDKKKKKKYYDDQKVRKVMKMQSRTKQDSINIANIQDYNKQEVARMGKVVREQKEVSNIDKPVRSFSLDLPKSDTGIPYFIVYDTETTGLIPKPHEEKDYPHIVQLSWILLDRDFKYISGNSFYIQQSKPIPLSATQIHGITNKLVDKEGRPIKEVLDLFLNDFIKVNIQVGHNIDFDIKMLRCELERNGYKPSIMYKVHFVCTMEESREYCKLDPRYYYDGMVRKYKSPKLTELVYKCFGVNINQEHNALPDVQLTAKCLAKLAEDLKLDLDIDKPELILDKYLIKKKKNDK